MGNFCKACEQKLSESNNEILGDMADTIFPLKRKNKMDRIKEKENSYQKNYNNNININQYIPEIIFLQRKIKKFLSKERESNQDIFYNKIYTNNITDSNNKLKDELVTLVSNTDIKKNHLKRSENFKTLSQKYNTLSNNSLINHTNEGKQYKVEKLQINENAIYTGQILNGKQHGFGIQEWNDGAKYEGDWENGKTNGWRMER